MTQTANVYARALYDLAREEGRDKEILLETRALQGILDETPTYVRLLAMPNLGKEERLQLLDESLRGRVDGYVLNVLKLMTERGHASQVPGMLSAYEEIYNEDHGILCVRCISAEKLTDDQLSRLADKLARMTGKQVTVQNQVDTAVLGGVRLDYDGKRVDDTVRARLDHVRALLEETTL